MNKGKLTKTSRFISDFWSYVGGTIVICVYLDKRKQGWLCMYNVTLRRVHAAIVAVEKQWVLHNLSVCICSLRHPARNVHAPCCHLWPAPLYIIFLHCLIHGTVTEKTLLNTKCGFWFSLQLSSETFLILRRNEWGTIKYVYWCSCTLYSCPVLNETWIFMTDFQKIVKIPNFIKICPVGAELFHADRQTWRS